MSFDKKQAIYNAALDLIADNGFHSSPMSVLAKKANVAAGTIYHYFESKEHLIASLYLELRLKLLDSLDIELENISISYRERFRRFFFSHYEYYLNNPKEFYFFEQFASSPLLGKIDREDLSTINQPLIDFVRKGVVTMQLKDLPTRLLWGMIHAQILALVRLHLNNEVHIDAENQKGAFDACWDGIKKNQ